MPFFSREVRGGSSATCTRHRLSPGRPARNLAERTGEVGLGVDLVRGDDGIEVGDDQTVPPDDRLTRLIQLAVSAVRMLTQ